MEQPSLPLNINSHCNDINNSPSLLSMLPTSTSHHYNDATLLPQQLTSSQPMINESFVHQRALTNTWSVVHVPPIHSEDTIPPPMPLPCIIPPPPPPSPPPPLPISHPFASACNYFMATPLQLNEPPTPPPPPEYQNVMCEPFNTVQNATIVNSPLLSNSPPVITISDDDNEPNPSRNTNVISPISVANVTNAHVNITDFQSHVDYMCHLPQRSNILQHRSEQPQYQMSTDIMFSNKTPMYSNQPIPDMTQQHDLHTHSSRNIPVEMGTNLQSKTMYYMSSAANYNAEDTDIQVSHNSTTDIHRMSNVHKHPSNTRQHALHYSASDTQNQLSPGYTVSSVRMSNVKTDSISSVSNTANDDAGNVQNQFYSDHMTLVGRMSLNSTCNTVNYNAGNVQTKSDPNYTTPNRMLNVQSTQFVSTTPDETINHDIILNFQAHINPVNPDTTSSNVTQENASFSVNNQSNQQFSTSKVETNIHSDTDINASSQENIATKQNRTTISTSLEQEPKQEPKQVPLSKRLRTMRSLQQRNTAPHHKEHEVQRSKKNFVNRTKTTRATASITGITTKSNLLQRLSASMGVPLRCDMSKKNSLDENVMDVSKDPSFENILTKTSLEEDFSNIPSETTTTLLDEKISLLTNERTEPKKQKSFRNETSPLQSSLDASFTANVGGFVEQVLERDEPNTSEADFNANDLNITSSFLQENPPTQSKLDDRISNFLIPNTITRFLQSEVNPFEEGLEKLDTKSSFLAIQVESTSPPIDVSTQSKLQKYSKDTDEISIQDLSARSSIINESSVNSSNKNILIIDIDSSDENSNTSNDFKDILLEEKSEENALPLENHSSSKQMHDTEDASVVEPEGSPTNTEKPRKLGVLNEVENVITTEIACPRMKDVSLVDNSLADEAATRLNKQTLATSEYTGKENKIKIIEKSIAKYEPKLNKNSKFVAASKTTIVECGNEESRYNDIEMSNSNVNSVTDISITENTFNDTNSIIDVAITEIPEVFSKTKKTLDKIVDMPERDSITESSTNDNNNTNASLDDDLKNKTSQSLNKQQSKSIENLIIVSELEESYENTLCIMIAKLDINACDVGSISNELACRSPQFNKETCIVYKDSSSSSSQLKLTKKGSLTQTDNSEENMNTSKTVKFILNEDSTLKNQSKDKCSAMPKPKSQDQEKSTGWKATLHDGILCLKRNQICTESKNSSQQKKEKCPLLEHKEDEVSETCLPERPEVNDGSTSMDQESQTLHQENLLQPPELDDSSTVIDTSPSPILKQKELSEIYLQEPPEVPDSSTVNTQATKTKKVTFLLPTIEKRDSKFQEIKAKYSAVKKVKLIKPKHKYSDEWLPKYPIIIDDEKCKSYQNLKLPEPKLSKDKDVPALNVPQTPCVETPISKQTTKENNELNNEENSNEVKKCRTPKVDTSFLDNLLSLVKKSKPIEKNKSNIKYKDCSGNICILDKSKNIVKIQSTNTKLLPKIKKITKSNLQKDDTPPKISDKNLETSECIPLVNHPASISPNKIIVSEYRSREDELAFALLPKIPSVIAKVMYPNFDKENLANECCTLETTNEGTLLRDKDQANGCALEMTNEDPTLQAMNQANGSKTLEVTNESTTLQEKAVENKNTSKKETTAMSSNGDIMTQEQMCIYEQEFNKCRCSEEMECCCQSESSSEDEFYGDQKYVELDNKYNFYEKNNNKGGSNDGDLFDVKCELCWIEKYGKNDDIVDKVFVDFSNVSCKHFKRNKIEDGGSKKLVVELLKNVENDGLITSVVETAVKDKEEEEVDIGKIIPEKVVTERKDEENVNEGSDIEFDDKNILNEHFFGEYYPQDKTNVKDEFNVDERKIFSRKTPALLKFSPTPHIPLDVLQGLVPEHWHCSSKNENSSHKAFFQNYTTRALFPSSEEYLYVASKFHESSSCVIIGIDKVENPHVWLRYNIRKEEMMRNGCEFGEFHVFHGTNKSNLDSILKHNLDISLQGSKVGSRYGCGMSFSPNAGYALYYTDICDSDINIDMINTVLMVRTFVGRSHYGGYGTVLPMKPCDTTHSYNNMVIVKYFDDEFYPDYVIHVDSSKNIEKKIEHLTNSHVPKRHTHSLPISMESQRSSSRTSKYSLSNSSQSLPEELELQARNEFVVSKHLARSLTSREQSTRHSPPRRSQSLPAVLEPCSRHELVVPKRRARSLSISIESQGSRSRSRSVMSESATRSEYSLSNSSQSPEPCTRNEFAVSNKHRARSCSGSSRQTVRRSLPRRSQSLPAKLEPRARLNFIVTKRRARSLSIDKLFETQSHSSTSWTSCSSVSRSSISCSTCVSCDNDKQREADEWEDMDPEWNSDTRHDAMPCNQYEHRYPYSADGNGYYDEDYMDNNDFENLWSPRQRLNNPSCWYPREVYEYRQDMTQDDKTFWPKDKHDGTFWPEDGNGRTTWLEDDNRSMWPHDEEDDDGSTWPHQDDEIPTPGPSLADENQRLGPLIDDGNPRPGLQENVSDPRGMLHFNVGSQGLPRLLDHDHVQREALLSQNQTDSPCRSRSLSPWSPSQATENNKQSDVNERLDKRSNSDMSLDSNMFVESEIPVPSHAMENNKESDVNERLPADLQQDSPQQSAFSFFPPELFK